MERKTHKKLLSATSSCQGEGDVLFSFEYGACVCTVCELQPDEFPQCQPQYLLSGHYGVLTPLLKVLSAIIQNAIGPISTNAKQITNMWHTTHIVRREVVSFIARCLTTAGRSQGIGGGRRSHELTARRK